MIYSRKSKLKVIIVVLAIVAFFIGSVAYLVFWNKTPHIAENQSYNLIDELRTLQVNGGTLELTEDEINSTFSTLFDKPIVKNGIVINGAYANIGEKKITLFFPIQYKGMNLLPNITGSIDYENDRLNFKITDIKLGKFRIPKSILVNRLKGYSSNDIIINEDKIEISKFLLPFNAENIYLNHNKIFAIISKIPQQQNIINSNVSNNNTSNNQSNTSQKDGQNSGGTVANNSSSNVKTSEDSKKTNNNSPQNTQSKATPPPAVQVKSLNKVSGQLNSVIASAQTDKERQMIKKIQTVVKEVAANPSYPYQNQANEVKAWYKTLKPEEKTHVKNAILNNVNLMDILKLINIFGV